LISRALNWWSPILTSVVNHTTPATLQLKETIETRGVAPDEEYTDEQKTKLS